MARPQVTCGILGFEWDETTDNGFLPPGHIRMSTTTIGVTVYCYDPYGLNLPRASERIILVFIATAAGRSFLAQDLPNGPGDRMPLTTLPAPLSIRE